MEITRLRHHQRIDFGCHPSVWRRQRLQSGLREIPVDGDVAVESVLLITSDVHCDPADQLIVATAMLGGMTLATMDMKIIDWANRTRLIPLVSQSLFLAPSPR